MIEEKKKNKLVGPFIIVLLLLLGAIGFILYDKGIILKPKEEPKTEKKEVKKEKKEESKEVLDVTDNIIQDLDKKYQTARGCFSHTSIYAGEKKDVNDSFTNKEAFNLVTNYMAESEKYKADIINKDSISGDKIKEVIKELFGSNYKYEHASDLSDCGGLEYDKATDTYKSSGAGGCGGTCVYSTYFKVVKAFKTDNKLEVYKRVLFFNSEKDNHEADYYSDYKFTNKVITVNLDKNPNFENELEGVLSKGSLYKTVYKLEDGNYIYDYTEPVKE